jgi:prepilin-type processing-associated H-X9-DG protein
MPQVQLPIFPEGVVHLTAELAVKKEDGVVTYFNGQMPVFVHAASDVASFRMITAQFYVTGLCTEARIAQVFGIPAISVKRAVKRYREQGPKGFFQTPRRRGAAVLTAEVIAQAEALLGAGGPVPEVAQRLGVLRNTLGKAVRAGRVRKPGAATPGEAAASTKSERSAADQAAEMGVGASNVGERLAASVGRGGEASVEFERAVDVPKAGVLLALPALLVMGLLQHTGRFFRLPQGYYGITSIFLLLAFLALARVRSAEKLRYEAPGEWGKVLGLDRVPEVRTLREKIAYLSGEGDPIPWSAELCREWMEAQPERAQVLYVDGHVRVYHGKLTKLPKRYVAREKLCLRATTDYWVNAMDGQPFFVVHAEVDPGLVQVLENEIVPRLEVEVPNQPSAEALAADRLRHRFTLVFDREGYSPAFVRRMWQRRIACLSYRKSPGADWGVEEFREHTVELSSGNRVSMQLAERGTHLGGKIWVREIRRRTESGHQTAIITTDYRSDVIPVALSMFARWSQENFFRYMREHYGLDGLVEYGTEEIPDTTKVVNPAYRRLDGAVRKTRGVLQRAQARFGALALDDAIEPRKVKPYEEKQANLHEEIARLSEQLAELKAQRKGVKRHITVGQLPEGERFERLRVLSKHLIDTIKMIAYRAETAMAQTLREAMPRSKHDEARSLLRALYTCEADLVPNEQEGTLTVRVHHLANRATAAAVQHLCTELTATETVFPGTELRLIYELVSSQNPRDQGS